MKWPDRWENYSPVGGKIQNSPFLPFKCPLSQKFFPKTKQNLIIPTLGEIFEKNHRINTIKRFSDSHDVNSEATTEPEEPKVVARSKKKNKKKSQKNACHLSSSSTTSAGGGCSSSSSVTTTTEETGTENSESETTIKSTSEDSHGQATSSMVGQASSSSSNSSPKSSLNSEWTPEKLLHDFPDLDLVIDLTNTKKYYDGQTLCQISPRVRYCKLFTKGHEVPDAHVVQKFFNEVDELVAENKDCVIGVHCTHGVNRTGYLICRYLIQRMNWEPQQALDEFAKARGHPVERVNYIADLKRAKWPPLWSQNGHRNQHERRERFKKPKYSQDDFGYNQIVRSCRRDREYSSQQSGYHNGYHYNNRAHRYDGEDQGRYEPWVQPHRDQYQHQTFDGSRNYFHNQSVYQYNPDHYQNCRQDYQQNYNHEYNQHTWRDSNVDSFRQGERRIRRGQNDCY